MEVYGFGCFDNILEIEDLHGEMILKLVELARLMDESSARVLEQVKCLIIGLRFRFALLNIYVRLNDIELGEEN